MVTDWNKKLAAVFQDLAGPASDLLAIGSHKQMLVSEPVEDADDARLGWVKAAADRLPEKVYGASSSAFEGAPLEVTHPLCKSRRSLEPLQLEALRSAAATLVADQSKQLADARARSLWLWRYLADELAERGGPWVHRIPADARMPDVSLWRAMAWQSAIAGALPEPTFLVFDLARAADFASQADTPADLAATSKLLSWLMWQSMLPVLEALGPDAILSPSLKGHPLVDRWLAEQGVKQRGRGEGVSSLPDQFVALVPSAMVEELGAACIARLQQGWEQVAYQVRDKLLADKVVGKGDASWNTIWSRQVSQTFAPSWCAVRWSADSSAAGSLLSKTDVAALEKWAKQQADASGNEDPWAGVYYGMWLEAALAASFARRRNVAVSVYPEAGPHCTMCGQREALHGETSTGAARLKAVHDLWQVAADRAKGLVAESDRLCAVCSVKRIARSLTDGGAADLRASEALTARAQHDQQALVLLTVDNIHTLMRGGRELKQAATLFDLLHSRVAEQLGRPRASRELLEAAPPLGPARHASVSEALADFARGSVPALMQEHHADLLYAGAGQVVAFADPDKAVDLVKSLRACLRSDFVELQQPQPKVALHLGPSATASAVIVIAPRGEPAGNLLREARRLLEGLARDVLQGDAIVVMLKVRAGEERWFAATWDGFDSTLGALLRELPPALSLTKLLGELRGLEAALANAELGRPGSDSRISLVRAAIDRVGFGEGDTDKLASAVCSTIDRGVAISADTDGSRALDGLHIARVLAGGHR